MFGIVEGLVRVVMVAEHRRPIKCKQGPSVEPDHTFEDCPSLDMMLVPGGMGTRHQVENAVMLKRLADRASETELVMDVCTGSGLLARAGVLDGRRATSNKRAFAWASSQGPNVEWIKRARWVHDGKFWTSAGVSAGMDMSLAVVADVFGIETAHLVAQVTEYDWHEDSTWDPFAALNGLVDD
jgi:transcriptional regulator GlxA family with amidase domain